MRTLSEIGREIRKVWRKKDGTPNVWYGAAPYLDAMCQLNSIDDMYGYDSARSVVRYFLANAAQFKGDDARRIKAELKEMVESDFGGRI